MVSRTLARHWGLLVGVYVAASKQVNPVAVTADPNCFFWVNEPDTLMRMRRVPGTLHAP
jgi:hypothetical protein